MRRQLSKHWWRVTKAQQGAKAQRAGAQFEDELEQQHQHWRAAGTATIMRAHPPVSGPPNHLHYTGPGGVDFVGLLCRRPIAFDAKSRTDVVSFRYDDRDWHQIMWLDEWSRMQSGTAFVLVRDKALDIAYVVFDVRTLALGNAVQLRQTARQGGAPLVPTVHYAIMDPTPWNYLPILQQRWTTGA